MAELRLADQVFVAVIQDRCIVLDLVKDRYVALSGAAARVLSALLAPSGAGAGADPADLAAAGDELLRRGLLAAGRGAPRPRRPPPAPPRETLWPSDAGGAARPGATAFLRALRALADVALRLRWASFAGAVGWVAARPVRPRRAGVSLQRALDDFIDARPWFPAEPICRLDAFALCAHLRRSGVPADLVFGVKLQPFYAHCWVQVGEVSVNEPHEVVRRFTPILRV